VLKQDKELVTFPIVSGIVSLVVLASFAGGAWGLGFFENLPENEEDFVISEHLPLMAYGFLFYFVSYFVVIYFNAALIGAAHIRLLGGDPTVADGFQAANRCLPSILGYALFAATVGTILKIIRDNSDNLIARIIAGLIGMAWTLITFLVVPVIVIERAGPVKAISRSAQLFKKTWGEQIVADIGFGLVWLLLALPGIALIVIAVFIGVAFESAIAAIALGAIALIYWIVLAVVISALQGIFVAALYSYASDEPTGPFPRELIAHAFHRR
jgi:hypothetical protein